jgi:serine/threonine protein kinase
MLIINFFNRPKLLKKRFRLIGELGKGNFGETFLAQDLHNGDRKCVVKQFLPEMSKSSGILDVYDKKARALFEDEAVLLGILGNHRQIPTLIANFQEKDQFYIVQEYIDGENLSAELKNHGIFNELKIRDFLRGISNALEHVHSNKVIHRDIKPSNIMRRFSDNQVVLIDFGSAKQIHSVPSKGTKISLDGTSLGTRGYAPYRQYHLGKSSYSNDMFSIGATCFNLMTNLSPSELCNEVGDRNGDEWVGKYLPYLNNNYSEALISLIKKMLVGEEKLDCKDINDLLNEANSSSIKLNTSPIHHNEPKTLEIDLSDPSIWTEDYKRYNPKQYAKNIRMLQEYVTSSKSKMPVAAYEAMKRDSVNI